MCTQFVDLFILSYEVWLLTFGREKEKVCHKAC